MEYRKVRPGEYRSFYSKMKRDFPPNERPPFFVFKKSLEKGAYNGFLLFDGNGADAGYAVVVPSVKSVENNETGLSLLFFFAIEPEMRGKGCGSEFLRLLSARYQSMLVEVEAPEALKTRELREAALKRISFYEKNGYKLIENIKANIFGVEMFLMHNGATPPENAGEALRTLYRPALPSEKLLKRIVVNKTAEGEKTYD